MSLCNGIVVFQRLVRRKLIVPNRIWRRYLEKRQRTLRDPTIKNKLFAFMGVNLPRIIQNRNICANKIQRAYRAHRILRYFRCSLWRHRRRMRRGARVIQCAYRCAKARERCAKARELKWGLHWLERCLGEERGHYDLNRWLGGLGWSLKRNDNIPITDATCNHRTEKEENVSLTCELLQITSNVFS